MSEDTLSRRSVLKGLGLAAVAGLARPVLGTSTDFTRVDIPTDKSLHAVAATEEGPYTAGAAGDLLARRAGDIQGDSLTAPGNSSGGSDERPYETVLEAGPTARSKTLYAAASSDDGRHYWVAGGSGVVAHYDVVDEHHTDFSATLDSSTAWHAMGVAGDAGAETVYLAGGSGRVVRGERTDDGGMTWGDPWTFNGGNTVYGMAVRSASEVWLCDAGGRVWRTQDGGSSWSQVGIDAAGVTLYDVAVESPTAVTVAGGSGYLYEYDGAAWTEYKPGVSAIRTVDRVSTDRQLAGGDGGHVYERSADGWTVHDLDTAKTIRDAVLDRSGEFPDVLVANSGRLFERGRYEAYPDTLRVESDATSLLDYEFDVSSRTRRTSLLEEADDLADESDGYHVAGTVGAGDAADAYEYGGDVSGFTVTDGSASALRTYVSGRRVSVERLADRTWTAVPTPTSKTLHEVVDSTAGLYAVGSSGRVLRRVAGEWVEVVHAGPTGGGNTLYGAGSTSDGERVWAGGGSGALGMLDAETGELTDFTAPDGLTSTWLDVTCAGEAGSELIFLVNGSGQVVRGRADGTDVEWSEPVKPGNGSTIYGVTFLDEQVGYVCDSNSDVYETTDGGASWHHIGVDDASVTLYDVAAVARDDIVAVGGSGRLFRYDGAVWTPVKTGGNSRYAVDREADRGVAVGGSAQVFEHEVTGWTLTQNHDSDVTLRGTLVTDDPTVPKVAVGGSGVVLEQSFADPLY